MARKEKKTLRFPLLVISSQVDDSRMPYIPRINVMLALQSLQLLALHGDAKALHVEINAMYQEVKDAKLED